MERKMMLEVIFILKFFIALFIFATSYIAYVLKTLRNQKNAQTAYIVVLGDIERSPRMKYHCLSLVKAGFNIKFIGYLETKVMDQISKNSSVSVASLRPYPKYLQVGPKIVQYCLKTSYLSINLFLTLVQQRPTPKFVLVQNPPSIPTLGIVYLYCCLADAKFVIDWHNYGFTILALTNSPTNILVKICRKFELYFGAKSDFNLCVTSAMKKDLESQKINAIVMYDKAHERFRQMNLKEKHYFYLRLIEYYKLDSLKNSEESTIFTSVQDGNIRIVKNRPAILVSSSSWTEDEDFHLLIDAFEEYQKKISEGKGNLPTIVCLLTGKGPLKEYYEEKFKTKNFKDIKVFFLWLDSDDYPRLLGSSDLGISFHKSSSNLDLPMKVVDMFGARLPVCALFFTCIEELVKPNQNGLLFSTGSQLAEQLCDLLPNIDADGSKLEKFRKNLDLFSNWENEWNEKFKPILDNL